MDNTCIDSNEVSGFDGDGHPGILAEPWDYQDFRV
jgi:hypothetical protein